MLLAAPGRFTPTIYLYDNYPGGIGLSAPLHERRDELVAHLAGSLRAGDLCVSMGCGDVETLPDEVLAALAEPA